ncbi:ATP-binding protein [Methyloceanibacter superfactus]|uniref:ATP-binding protein n=1 Tax=Methyloceanibacter superfactus TaxID=1774969 RepID=UPI000B27AEE7|nr:HAMP domain-containing sensor histidine kinase [Methyloceanibacter superfactus]
MLRTSLKSRLIAAAVLWIAIGMVGAGVMLSAVFKHHVTEQFYDELHVHLAELQRLSEFHTDGSLHLQHPLSDPRYDVPLSGFYWEIQKKGDVLARSASLEGPPLHMPPDTPKDVGVHTHLIEGPTGPLIVAEKAVWTNPSAAPDRFIIGTDERHLDAVVSSFNTTLAVSLAAFGLSLVAAATLLILYALRPLGQLRTALFEVRHGKEKQLSGRFPAEVVPLVDDLNTLLTSTADLIQRARTQAGNMAHGLKTPLAIITDEAYRLEDQGLDQASSTILKECRKMQSHIDYQITRARAVAMRSAPGVVAGARKAALEVASALGRLYAHNNTKMDVDVPEGRSWPAIPPISTRCWPTWSTMPASMPNRRSESAGPMAWMLRLTVDDDGPGLPPEAREVVFNIGERWDSRAAGSGLGLGIVRDLARLYGGDVRLGESSSEDCA